MTADMLDEGAGGKDALALADAIDFLGATIGAGAVVGRLDGAAARAGGPARRRRSRCWRTSRCGRTSRRPSSQRLRKEALTDLLQARDEPGAIAARALAQAVFGPATATASRRRATPRRSRRFTVAELRAFHAARYAPGAASLVVVGDVTAAVLPALEKAFGSWKAVGAPPRRCPSCRRRASSRRARVWLVDKKGAAQSSLRLGRVGPSWPDPAYAPERGDEHAARRLVHLAAQRQPARAARLRLRRRLGLPAQPRGRACSSSRPTSRPTRPAPALGEVFKELDRILTARRRRRRWSARATTRRSATPATSRPRARSRSAWSTSVVYGLPDGFYEALRAAGARHRRRRAAEGRARGDRSRSGSRWSWSATAPRSRRRCAP